MELSSMQDVRRRIETYMSRARHGKPFGNGNSTLAYGPTDRSENIKELRSENGTRSIRGTLSRSPLSQ